MENYNNKLLKATEKLSKDTLEKSNALVDKLTHPSEGIDKKGSALGTGVGAGLIAVGIIATFGGKIWGVGSCAAGICTIASNIIKKKK